MHDVIRLLSKAARLASFFWIQSMVRRWPAAPLRPGHGHQPDSRALPDLSAVIALTSCYHNLLRAWRRRDAGSRGGDDARLAARVSGRAGPAPAAAQPPAPLTAEADPVRWSSTFSTLGGGLSGRGEGRPGARRRRVQGAGGVRGPGPCPPRAPARGPSGRRWKLSRRPSRSCATSAPARSGHARRRAALALIAAYRIEVAPSARPISGGAPRSKPRLRLCHGATGHGDGPGGPASIPSPAISTTRSAWPSAAFPASTAPYNPGRGGDGLCGFRAPSEDERWPGLSRGRARHARSGAGNGGWRGGKAGQGRTAFPRSRGIDQAQPARALRPDTAPTRGPFSPSSRAQPDAVGAKGNDRAGPSLRLLHTTAWRRTGGRAREAHDLTVSSYLDGSSWRAGLDAVDRGLRMEVEAEMLRFRGSSRTAPPLAAWSPGPHARGVLGGSGMPWRSAGCRPAPSSRRVHHPPARGPRGHPGAGRPHRVARQGNRRDARPGCMRAGSSPFCSAG